MPVMTVSVVSSTVTVSGTYTLSGGLPAINDMVVTEFRDSTTVQFDVRITPTGEVRVTRNGTTLNVTSGHNFDPTIPHKIRARVTVDANGSYTVWVDGVPVLTDSGVNTQASGNPQVTDVFVGPDPYVTNYTPPSTSTYPESTHPYINNLDDTQGYTDPTGPEWIKVTFSLSTEVEDHYDHIYLYDAYNEQIGPAFTGTQLAGLTVIIPGDTVIVRLVSDPSSTAYGYKISSIEAYTPPILQSGVVLAGVHVYAGPTSYLTQRASNGSWSESLPFSSGADVMSGLSAGYMSSAWPNRKGIVSGGGYSGIISNWAGNGFPSPDIKISVSNSLIGDAAPNFNGWWNCSYGGWWVNGAWYVLLRIVNGGTTLRFAMLKSVGYAGGDPDRPTLWTEMDQGNTPTHAFNPSADLQYAAARWDGVSTLVDLIAPADALNLNYLLHSYDFSTDTWGTPYGAITFGSSQNLQPFKGQDSNNIFRFPNDDIGIIHWTATGLYFKLYERASNSWQSSVLIKATGAHAPRLGVIIPDPSRESLHVFAGTFADTDPAYYHIVPHMGAPLTDLFEWNFETEDSFGNGTIFNGQIAIPYDDVTDNIIWVAPLTGGATTFTAERLPRPAWEFDVPSCTTLFYIPSGGEIPPDVSDLLSISDKLEIGLGLIFDSLLTLLDSLGLPWTPPSVSDLMMMLDLVRISLTKGSKPTIPVYEGCDVPENASGSAYCTGFKDYRTNTLEEIDPCEAVVYEVTEEVSCI